MGRPRFEITVLGCGAAVPAVKRNPSSQVLNINEQHYLIDCGEGTQVQLRKFKIKFQKINQIFISHLHGDHFFGLIGLISTYHLLGRSRELKVFSPEGLEEIIRIQLEKSGTYLRYPLTFIPVDTTRSVKIFENNTCEVFNLPLKHRIPCTGYLFKEKQEKRTLLPDQLKKFGISIAYANKIKQGEDVSLEDGTVIENEKLTLPPPDVRSYAYCSDTAYHEPLIEHISNVNCLYHESTFLREDEQRSKQTMHSTSEQAANIAMKANVGKLVLGHYSARYDDIEDFVNEAKPIFPNVTASSEGLVINV